MSMLINRHTQGVFVIAATPFTDSGELDLASTETMIDFYLGCGVSGITILGVMGEAPKLDQAEAIRFAECVLKRVNGRVPVIVGVTAAGTDNLVTLAKTTMQAGAAGAMVSPIPGLNTEAKLHRYFVDVCEALGPDIPVCYQDFPQASAVHISVESILQLTRELPQLVMLKHEDYPGLAKLSRVREESDTADTPRLSILTGNGGIFLPQELQRGADGAMTGFAYPEMLVQVIALHKAGETDLAEDLFNAYLPLVRYELQPGFGLAIRKETLRRRGVIQSAKVRAPGPSLTATDQQELTRLINWQEKKLDEEPLKAISQREFS